MSVPIYVTELISGFQAFSGTFFPFSAVAVAYAGWKVANQQAITARQKLRLDLFPHRMEIYRTAHRAIVSAVNFDTNSVVFDQETMKFRDALLEARFMFGADAFDYFDALLTTILQYRHVEGRLRSDQDYYSADHLVSIREQHETNTQFIFGALQHLHKYVGPYLRVEEKLTTSWQISEDSLRA